MQVPFYSSAVRGRFLAPGYSGSGVVVWLGRLPCVSAAARFPSCVCGRGGGLEWILTVRVPAEEKLFDVVVSRYVLLPVPYWHLGLLGVRGRMSMIEAQVIAGSVRMIAEAKADARAKLTSADTEVQGELHNWRGYLAEGPVPAGRADTEYPECRLVDRSGVGG